MNRFLQELDKLIVMVTVAEKGKINEAAELLHLTQPSVTRSIQKLESAFGAEIFSRSREGVKLTQAGTLLYQKAAQILRDLEDVQERARHLDHDLTGIVTVGTYESLAEYLWPEFLQQLADIHPYLQLSIKTGLNRDPTGDLLSGRIDLLVDAEPQIKGALVSWPLYQDRFGIYISPKVKLKSCSPQDSLEQTIIFVQNALDENRWTIEDHLEKAGHRFARKYCFDSFSTVKRLVIMGMGIGVLPMKLAQEDVKNRRLRPLAMEGFNAKGFGRHTICATVSDANKQDGRIKKIVGLLKAHLK